MKNNRLKLKFYINANHAVMFGESKISSIHGHTWEVATTLIEESANLNQFHVLEKKITDYLSRYKEQVINDVYPFSKINPTMENMALVFFEDIENLLIDTVYTLECIEVLENPTRTYAVYSAVGYRDLESSDYENAMTREMDKARGIIRQSDERKLVYSDDKVNKVLSDLKKSINEMDERHKKRAKKKRLRMIVFTIIVLVLLGGFFALYKFTDVLDLIGGLI